MKFSLFHKSKQEAEPQTPAAPQEQPKVEESAPAPEQAKQEPAQEPQVMAEQNVLPVAESKREGAEPVSKTYLKAMPLKDLADVENVKSEVRNGNIIILRVTPLANKSLDDVKSAVNELFQFSESTGGDIARLGEERVVICPKNIRIWREKTPVQDRSLPTAAPTAA
jgi:SepF-like predicted cell division protein (DUF552 family)